MTHATPTLTHNSIRNPYRFGMLIPEEGSLGITPSLNTAMLSSAGFVLHAVIVCLFALRQRELGIQLCPPDE
ncbi:hypothetical protein VTN00DRAFT_5769 [Thermoascus crustaceus]|uniref:uncharacterized protein n=1 Tax=Thermoascus crustaceus TaxID=5088 RepID=UPI0037446215